MIKTAVLLFLFAVTVAAVENPQEVLLLRKMNERLEAQEERIRVLEDESLAHESEMAVVKWLFGCVATLSVIAVPFIMVWEKRKRETKND